MDGAIVILHLDRVLVSKTRHSQFDFPLINTDESQLEEAGEDLAALTRRLDEVTGIQRVGYWPYRMQFSKALVFDWTELLPRILDALQSALNVASLDVKQREVPGRPRINLGGQELPPFEE